MKQILTHNVLEETKYFCDNHPTTECFSEINLASWYGSKYDMTGVEIHLCDDCLKEIYNFLEQKFGIYPKNIII